MKQKPLSETHIYRLYALGSYLRELRFSEGLTISDAATDLNVHKNTLSRSENGCNMTLVTLFEICDYYGIPANEMLGNI